MEILLMILRKEYIHDERFTNTMNKLFREQIIQLLEDYIVVISASFEELTPSDLSPHKFRMKPNTKLIKRKYFGFSKFKSDVLKEKLLNFPILKFPLFKKDFIIRTYNSYDGVEGVLIL